MLYKAINGVEDVFSIFFGELPGGKQLINKALASV
jgi:cytochrome b involved in lipid metabolism